jgi:hypothetical protein
MIQRLATLTTLSLLAVSCATAIASPASAVTRVGGVSMQGACDNQYPGQGRLAKIRTWNVYGWKCVTGVVPVADGDIDVWRQCRAQYGAAAYGGYGNYNDPYSWSCYR